MNIVRPAKYEDLRAIYDLQNVPFRKKVFHSPLPSFEEFEATVGQKFAAGEEHYWIQEQNEIPVGFVWFMKSGEYWYATVWGKWLRTLVYAGQIAAFRCLNFPRLLFCVRQENTRMIRLCQEYGFRYAGQASTFYISEEAPYLGIATLSYYDIRAEEFWEQAEEMRKKSLNVEFQTE